MTSQITFKCLSIRWIYPKLYKTEEVLDMVLPSPNEAAEVGHPGKEAFYFPAS
jgi:hypothetical protein